MGSPLPEPAGVPDLVGSGNFQNKNRFFLDDEQEIYEGYGALRSAYPYTQFNAYGRKLEPVRYKAAILENEAMRAVFLPELGGRLWSLRDKKRNRDIIYTNDVLRFSNLALRNAWFSGGAEWNISMIGHSPFTTAPIYAAELTADDGTPILRMYDYERVRGVEYQMDFWLDGRTSSLQCRMRISNSGKNVVPMYWWSTIAVPEYPDGRLVVPAKEAYASGGQDVVKTSIPIVNGKDISFYENTDEMIDYFFDQERGNPSYIANLARDGYGFLHIASERMRSHKLFSWGHDENAKRWQRFLTENAGPYIELQGGLGKTQYGCIPMAPNTSWEWSEIFTTIDVEPACVRQPYELLEEKLTSLVRNLCGTSFSRLEEPHAFTKQKGKLVFDGQGYGRLCGRLRNEQDEKPLSSHLEYPGGNKAVDFWIRYLDEGHLPEVCPSEKPLDFICDRLLFKRLEQSSQSADKDNWYAFYQMGVYCVWKEKLVKAEKLLLRAVKLSENPWICHALASLYLMTGDNALANLFMGRGLKLRGGDLSYAKEGLRLLALGGGYEEIILAYKKLPRDIQGNDRLSYYYCLALHRTGKTAQAKAAFKPRAYFMLDDIKEGTDPLRDLHTEMGSFESNFSQ